MNIVNCSNKEQSTMAFKLTRLEDKNGWQRFEYGGLGGFYSILLNEDGECEQATYTIGKITIVISVERILIEDGVCWIE